MRKMTTRGRTRQPYAIRQAEPDDGDAFASLFRTVWDEPRTADWFRWKYVENPYLDEIPVFIAETEGEVVGSRSFVPLRMRAGNTTPLALLATDAMVHPAHRRRGLFTRMTEQAIDRYTHGEPAFAFNQPNAASLPGYRKLGWRALDEMTTYYRVQRPEAFVDDRAGNTIEGPVGRIAGPFARGYLRTRDAIVDTESEVAVACRRGVAAGRLAALYERRVPRELHALRDATYYRWRFAGPMWERDTYVARRDGEPVAGVIVRTRTTHERITVTQLADVVPIVGGGEWEATLSRLLDRIIDDHQDSDLISVSGRGMPANLLSARGFHPDDAFPLSALKSVHCKLMVRPLVPDEDGWTIGGQSLTDPAAWRLSFGERDTA